MDINDGEDFYKELEARTSQPYEDYGSFLARRARGFLLE
jgi:hypothetical protein